MGIGIIDFFKIKFTSGKKVLGKLTTYQERLDHAAEQLKKKKKLLEKHAEAVHKNVITIEDRINTATDNANQALAHAEDFLKHGDEVNAKLQYKMYETAKRAVEMYQKALEKANEAKAKIDEAVSNYDITIGDVMAKIADLRTMAEVNAIADFTTDDGVPSDIADFLQEIEEDIKDESFDQQAKAEVKALSKVAVVKNTSFTARNSDAEFEKFKASVLQ